MAETSDAAAVRAAHRFDEARLAAYLREHIAGFAGPLAVRQFKGGQSNPTFLLEAGPRRLVLRKKPPGRLLASAHQIEREHRILAALGATDVPVPAVRLLCEDAAIIGTPFYVMDYCAGRVFWDPALPDLTPAERGAVYDAMNDTLARLHAVDWRALGLAGFGRPENYVARQIARWTRQYEASRTGTIAAMDQLIAWLPAHVPPGEETTVVHGDFRLDNLIFHPTEPRVLALLDWELSTLGHPLGDLAYNCMAYHLPTGLPALSGIAGLDLATAGIPAESAYLAAYCRRAGRDGVAHWPFFLAFGMFRLAAIVQGIEARARQGNASSERALSYGSMATLLAETAWRVADASYS